jgi:hypothetical protein
MMLSLPPRNHFPVLLFRDFVGILMAGGKAPVDRNAKISLFFPVGWN